MWIGNDTLQFADGTLYLIQTLGKQKLSLMQKSDAVAEIF